jgi:hypothetical protein
MLDQKDDALTTHPPFSDLNLPFHIVNLHKRALDAHYQ